MANRKMPMGKIENPSVRRMTCRDFLLSIDSFLLADDEKPDSAQLISREELTPNIPNFAQYLIIGGGTTAMSAFKSIRAHDPTAKVRAHCSRLVVLHRRTLFC